MKNWKCIIGATVATPICVCLLLALLFGFGWLIENITALKWMCSILISMFFLGLIWTGLFFSCCDFWRKRKYNQRMEQTGESSGKSAKILTEMQKISAKAITTH